MAETELRQWRIAKALKQARAQKQPRLSQAQIAERVEKGGLSYFTERHASRLELGYMDATTAEVRAIAGVLGVSPDWLCGAAVTPVPTTPPMGNGLARATQVPPSAVPSPAAEADSRWPVCPGLDRLERGADTPDAHRARLIDLRAQANRMLHTSGLPAAQWRQWRELERQIAERLRAG
ncbi:MAG: helix-turn-helix transcriptional regulator [Opitutaceae bacterium]|nr:helix-turn-helix transcriptional regulator [Opitutaceae bacterium]